METFLWWMGLCVLIVWMIGIVWLIVLMIKDYAKGDRFGWRECISVLIWPIEFAKGVFIVVMVTWDDSIG